MIERFPVGQRLAFDSMKGRLWVICPACARWNLSPLEERWEAVEEAERQFRATHLRLATEHIGLARLPEGLELVRIGKPQRPELAAWRYGTRLVDRRRRYLLGSAATGLVMVGYASLQFIGVISSGLLLSAGLALQQHLRGRRLVCRVPEAASPLHMPIDLHRSDVEKIHLVPTGTSWEVELRDVFGPWREEAPGIRVQRPTTIALNGSIAREVLTRAMPVINAAGSTERLLQDALKIVDEAREPDVLLPQLARGENEAQVAGGYHSISPRAGSTRAVPLLELRSDASLALEMLLHEEQEHQALAGELQALEIAWREAEALAQIADQLALPSGIEQKLQRLRNFVSRAPV